MIPVLRLPAGVTDEEARVVLERFRRAMDRGEPILLSHEITLQFIGHDSSEVRVEVEQSGPR